ncbi:MAG: ATP-binding protein [Gammaproteobacteria bacterium]
MRAWLQRLRRSLSLRLTLLFLCLAVVLAVVFLYGLRLALSRNFHDVMRPHIEHHIDALAAEIGTPPSIERAQALVARLPLQIIIRGPRVNWPSHADSDTDYPIGRAHGRLHPPVHVRVLADGHRIMFRFPKPDREGRPAIIGAITLAVLLLLTAASYWLVRRLFLPLDDIRAGAIRFGSGDFSQPIPKRRDDDLGDLASEINAMAVDIRRMLDAKRQLLLAISHELRSPLARARINTELLAESGERDALLRDLAVMRDLIEKLLEGERLNDRHAALYPEPIDLNALVDETVADALGEGRLEIELAPRLPTLMLDRTRLQLLLHNLIDNALRHGREAAKPPIVMTAIEAHRLRLSVRDFGPGVAAAHLTQLVEPFYRTDRARTPGRGGVGLGLYLCRRIAEAHGGTLSLRNAHPGLEVVVSLPWQDAPERAKHTEQHRL